MIEKKYRVHDWAKFQYSEIGEYIDENHTDKPLRNDEICGLLNEQHKTIKQLRSALKELKEIGDYQADRIQELSDENRQLEQQMQTILELTKKIEDCTHDMKLIGDVE